MCAVWAHKEVLSFTTSTVEKHLLLHVVQITTTMIHFFLFIHPVLILFAVTVCTTCQLMHHIIGTTWTISTPRENVTSTAVWVAWTLYNSWIEDLWLLVIEIFLHPCCCWIHLHMVYALSIVTESMDKGRSLYITVLFRIISAARERAEGLLLIRLQIVHQLLEMINLLIIHLLLKVLLIEWIVVWIDARQFWRCHSLAARFSFIFSLNRPVFGPKEGRFTDFTRFMPSFFTVFLLFLLGID